MKVRCANCDSLVEVVPDDSGTATKCPSCGTAIHALDETRTYRGSRVRHLAQFELLECVGRGHFGEVWKARDTRLQRLVAVKIPRIAGLDDESLGLLLREARSAARVKHPGVVAVHEVGHDGDSAFIVSDFIRGVTLAAWLKDSRPDPQRAAELCAEIGEALHHAHEAGVIHRDLKPGNVMMDERGRPHVMDFGLAKHELSESTIAVDGAILGTPAYMAPEQARGNASAADRRSDVYSLGVVLYEMLTGKRPFRGESSLILHKVLSENPVPPRSLQREIPRDLETICLKAIDKDPRRRYATAEAMSQDLRRFLRGEPILARRTGLAERALRWVRRNRVVAASVGVAVVALSLLAAAILLRGEPVVPPSPQSRTVQMTTNPAGAEMYFVPLDEKTGEPQPKRIVKAGKSPVEAKLVPGDYLVVAVISDDRFHEVYRHVPAPDEGLTSAFPHKKATLRENGVLELPAIRIPKSSIVEAMASFRGGSRFQMGSQDTSRGIPAHHRRVPAFRLDRHEVTVAEFQKSVGGLFTIPPTCEAKMPPDDHPIVCVSWDQAVAYAESAGKRLPTEAEYEFAATNGGTQEFPWNRPPGKVTEWSFGPAAKSAYDRLKTRSGATVLGLYSNVAEWTISRNVPYPAHKQRGTADARTERIVRGGPISVAKGHPDTRDWKRGPRQRVGITFTKRLPRLGFRCARSARPRIRPEDFETVVAE